jgi:putative hemolysin
MNRLISTLAVIVLLGLVACGAGSSTMLEISETTGVVPSVATEFCLEQGYQLTVSTDVDGTMAHCLFPDGSRCELWAFYEGACPGPEVSR